LVIVSVTRDVEDAEQTTDEDAPYQYQNDGA
jgi:hypothetical protein